MFPSKPIDWVTRAPVIETVTYRTRSGETEAELYRPPGRGPYPAVLVCLGVVPFGVDHPQIPRLKAALARFGFVALIHWSPAMRDRRLVPEDVENVAAAYDYLVRRPDGSTRVITRVRAVYRWMSPTILFSMLIEFADIWMIRKMLLNVKERAESLARAQLLAQRLALGR